MATKRQRAEKNITYCRVQMERFLEKYYKLKFRGEVFGNKRLFKENRLAKTTFKERGFFEIDVDYQLLMGGNKEKLLHAVLREAVRVVMWYQGKSTKDGSVEYDAELRKFGLPVYGGLSETGLKLHTYTCSGCGKVWSLQQRKLPASKDPSVLNMVTGCCRENFEYTGQIEYTNSELQKIRELLKK